MVTKVSPTSPSAASFRKYDVIVEVNGHPIHDMNEADYYLDKCKIDTNANFKVIRGVSGRWSVEIIGATIFICFFVLFCSHSAR